MNVSLTLEKEMTGDLETGLVGLLDVGVFDTLGKDDGDDEGFALGFDESLSKKLGPAVGSIRLASSPSTGDGVMGCDVEAGRSVGLLDVGVSV